MIKGDVGSSRYGKQRERAAPAASCAPGYRILRCHRHRHLHAGGEAGVRASAPQRAADGQDALGTHRHPPRARAHARNSSSAGASATGTAGTAGAGA